MATEEKEFDYNPDENYDEATLIQQKAIEKEIATAQNLVGNREDISVLVKEYAEEDVIYREKVQDMSRRYRYLRRTRGDGNCFYRAFGFSYLERLLHASEEYTRDLIMGSKDNLLALGFPQFTLEDFHDTFMEVLEKVGSSEGSLEDLLETFNHPGFSDYIVVYLRLLVSGHLQKEEEFYSNFVEGGRTVKEFCNQEVEPMGKESDHIHIIALTSATSVPVRIEYMDRGGESVNHHDFPEGSEPKIHLLYRPGHYDILYTITPESS